MSRSRRRPPARVPSDARPRSRPPSSAPSSTRRWIWFAAGGVAIVIGIAIAFSSTGGDTGAPTGTRDPQAIAAGAELFAANCAVCHGTDLRGTATGPPFLDLIYAPNHHGDESFQRAVLGGVVPHHWNFGPMPALPGLARDDVALIVEYVRSEQEAAGILQDPSH